MLSIKVPPLGESIVEATVSRWLKNEGDAVAAGDTLVELETDKITVEVPALKAGILSKRGRAEGDVVHVDDVLGELDETASGSGAGAAASGGAASETAARGSAPAPDTSPQSGSGKSSPAARRVAEERGVDIAGVVGTGRGGVVNKGDVLGAEPDSREHADEGARGKTGGMAAAAAEIPALAKAEVKQPLAPSTPAPVANAPVASGTRETREKMTTRRKRIAENLLQSQHNTAHLTTFNEVDMSAINALREKFKEKVEKEHGVKLTFMPFFVKAACAALKQFAMVNAQIDGDSIVYKHYVNMGIAVASEQGLVVPNLKDADRRSVIELSGDIAAVAKRARDSKLSMEDLTGGTFTITNGGVFGSLISTPIINYPQVGILGLHKTQDRPVAIEGRVEIRPMMYIALSYDHRIVDGQQAVLFLVRVKELIEDPAALLIT
ncbi:MAG TPA: 2-oxoglutarate dehydrogenase complex dihydrolipoyllysine-residue succinyltransferase [Gemmatimonadaceae bacterium]|nr:2-oxoglutarate dehydrogenase complex dihydrolipoyllysine-residue succinyltransferase [Gemmatimonadaceae bacterium]